MWYDADIDEVMSRTARASRARQERSRPEEALAFGITLSIGSCPCSLGLAVNWFAGRIPRLHDLLLRRHLHDVAEALDAAEHRYRRRRRCLSSDDRLGIGNRGRQLWKASSCS
jgi:hypothetical protein